MMLVKKTLEGIAFQAMKVFPVVRTVDQCNVLARVHRLLLRWGQVAVDEFNFHCDMMGRADLVIVQA